jgi:regulatory protein YycH of two-component signal transduction system YycFG
MTYENIKSAILTILVLGSFYFTWNLWTYQPKYETIEKSHYVEEVSIGEKREVKKIIKPDLALFHIDGKHYGTEASSELERIIRQMGQWEIEELKNYTDKVEDFKDFVHGNGNVEIIFPEEVPLPIYKNVLTFANDKSIPQFRFDRIVIHTNQPHQQDSSSLYFISYKNKQVYSSQVDSSQLVHFNETIVANANEYPTYFTYEPKFERVIFLPEMERTMMMYKYYPDFLDSEKFKEALFPDPSFVQKSFISEGEEYTDGSSKMNIFSKDYMLFYVNPVEESEFIGNSTEILQRGIDFINEHGGWTDPYRYVGMDDWNQQIIFRLYTSDGYPVFNETGMSEMIEVWGRTDITKYLRPNFSLNLPLRSEMVEVKTPSGGQILDFLNKQKDFQMEQLEDLRLGYRMEKDSKEPRLIVLEPAWFYRYNGDWGQVRLDYLRGERNGLE